MLYLFLGKIHGNIPFEEYTYLSLTMGTNEDSNENSVLFLITGIQEVALLGAYQCYCF